MTGVGVGEEQLQLAAGELGRDLLRLAGELLGQLGVAQLGELDQVPRPRLQPPPLLALLAEPRRLLGVAARQGGVVPGPGLGQELL